MGASQHSDKILEMGPIYFKNARGEQLLNLRHYALSCALIVSVTALLTAGENRTIPRNAKIFIEEMAEDLDGYIRAELVNKKVPLSIVLKREDAHIVMAGSSTGNEKRSWHEGWLTSERDHSTGNVMIFDRASKSMLWACEAGDRSLWWGAMARGGQRKVASRLMDKLKDVVARQEQALPVPPPLSAEEMAAATSSATIAAKGAASVLINEDVVKMIKAGLSDDLVISKIRTSQCSFNLETDAIIALKEMGASNAVLGEMMQTAKK